MADYGPLGGVKIAGFISPGDTTDSYAVIDTTLGIDGLRNYSGDTIEVLSGTTITELRRRAGMIVGIDSGSRYFKLKDKNPWDYDLTDWEEIFFSGGGGAPITGGTAFPATQTLTFYNSSGGTFNVVGGEYLFSDLSVTGGTYNPDTGCVTFETNSATTFDVCGFLTISADTFVTGATLNGDILEIGRNQSKPLISVDLSSLVFSGNTSGDCINQLWVSNISGCTGQDLHIGVQPGQDIYFDSTGSTTSPSLYINSKGQIGIGTNTPFSWATNDGTGIEVHNDNTNDQIPLAFTELGTRRFYFETDFATTYNPVHLKGSSGTNLVTFYTSGSNARVGFGTTIPDGTLQVAKSGLIANQSKYPDETNIVINNTSSGYSGDTNPNSAAFRFDHGTGEDPGGLITSKRLPSWDTGEKSTSLEIWNASGETLFKRIEILPDGETTISGELIVDKEGLFFTNLDNSSGPTVNVSGNTAELVEFRVITPTAKAISIGSRGETETTYPGYGKQGDGFLYSSAAQNGLNIISSNGAATEDYIRFFAGTNATSTPSMIILGTGATQGNVGINTNSPTEKLHIEGSIKIVDGTEQNGYVLTSNANGVGSWQPSTGGGGSFTGNTSGDCISDLWVSNIHSCSPLNINPGDEGNVYYGSTSGVTIDVSNSRIGIGTDDPDFPLHVVSTNQVEVKIESSTNNAFLTLSSSNGTNSYIDYEDGSGDRWIVGAHGGDDEKFKWATGTTFGSDTVMTLTREAKLGIGTSDPQANLHIKGITPPIEDNIFLL